MERPLALGVDGSDSSLEAVDEAARHGLSVRLVRGSLREHYERPFPPSAPTRPSGAIMAVNIAASCAERAWLRNPDPKISGGC
ncbi:hypothetical protein [Streptomyces canus]|uniref:hypothetical protein n=1 Tax=Streptomyces canus TaxID=58343 RepID=UPI003808C90D